MLLLVISAYVIIPCFILQIFRSFLSVSQSVVHHPPIRSIPLEETFFFCLVFCSLEILRPHHHFQKAQVSQYISDFWEEIVLRIAFNVPIPFPFCVGETEMVKLWNQQVVQRELGALWLISGEIFEPRQLSVCVEE